MSYKDFKINAKQSDIVEVNLEQQSNVMLLTSSDFNKYKTGQGYRYYGDYYKETPLRLSIPFTGLWYVVVDLGGYAGIIKASAELTRA